MRISDMGRHTRQLRGVIQAAGLLVSAAILVTACGPTDRDQSPGSHRASTHPPETADLREALTFHASFDNGPDADYAKGDPVIYFAPSWAQRSAATEGLPGDSLIAIDEGVYGSALRFVRASPSIVLFRAQDNVAYHEEDWSGTISFWLSLTPDEDLEPGFSDPIQVSSGDWNDAALFVDFTRDDVPRQFRFAAFADYLVWNPDDRNWDEIAVNERPMIVVETPPFDRDRWTHVVLTFERFNTGENTGELRGYLNGRPYGTLPGRDQTFSWNLEEAAIAIGINYVGRFDELSVFDRALTADEVAELYSMDGGVAALL